MQLFLYITILVTISFIHCYALHTTLAPRQEFCVYKKVTEGDKLNINYVSSGTDEHKMIMRVPLASVILY